MNNEGYRWLEGFNQVATEAGKTLVVGGLILGAIGGGLWGIGRISDYAWNNHREAYLGLENQGSSYNLMEKRPRTIQVLEGRGFVLNWYAVNPEGIEKIVILEDGNPLVSSVSKRNDDGSYPTQVYDIAFPESTEAKARHFQLLAIGVKGDTLRSDVAVANIVN